MRLYNGDKVKVSEDLEGIYQARGWEYNKSVHDQLIGMEGQVVSIEDKYCFDYCFVEFEHFSYNGTLPIQALLKVE